jgi:hypothetical protein
MSTALTATEVAARHHRRALRFFAGWLAGRPWRAWAAEFR